MYELDKPCVVYREDCPLYEKEGDAMNREEAIEELKAIKSEYSNKAFEDSRLMRSEIEALNMAIKALEQDNCPYYVIDEDGHGLCKNHSGLHLSQRFKDWQFIQEPKTGHWIKDDITERSKSAYKHKCDRCGAYHRAMYDYCPSCGCRMVEPKESDHKCHTCKHYTSGEYDGSCDSYICEHYSDWEASDKE